MADDNAEVDAAGLNRRALLRNAAIAGTAAWSAPVILGSIASPAAAASGGSQSSMSLQLPPNLDHVISDQDREAFSSEIFGGVFCALAGYVVGESPIYSVLGSANSVNGNFVDSAVVTVFGLPESGTCTVTGIGACGNLAGCDTQQATKAPGETTATLTFTRKCGNNTSFDRIYLYISCA